MWKLPFRTMKARLLWSVLLVAVVELPVQAASQKSEAISLFADEEATGSVVALDVDSQSRVWVAGYGASDLGKEKSRGRIAIIDSGGRAVKSEGDSCFASLEFVPTGICVAGNRIYVSSRTAVWLLDDKDANLSADGAPKQLLSGFGINESRDGVHGLTLGPDHRLYFAVGDAGFDVTGPDGTKIQSATGAIVRCELDGSKAVILATGFRNPRDVAVNSLGQVFCTDHELDGGSGVRVCRVFERGDYGWRGRPEPKFYQLVEPGHPPASRPTKFGVVPSRRTIETGTPGGICVLDNVRQGEQCLYHCNDLTRRIEVFGDLGSLHSGKGLTREKDSLFHPVDICIARGGYLIIGDRSESVNVDGSETTSVKGRIFRLEGRYSMSPFQPNRKRTVADVAINDLWSPNLATQFVARETLIAEGERALPELRYSFEQAQVGESVKYMVPRLAWVLDRIGGEGRDLVKDLIDKYEYTAIVVSVLRRHSDDPEIRKLLYQRCMSVAQRSQKSHNDIPAEIARELYLFLAEIPGDEAIPYIGELAKAHGEFQIDSLRIAAAGREEKLKRYWAATQFPYEKRTGNRYADGDLMLREELINHFDESARMRRLRERMADNSGYWVIPAMQSLSVMPTGTAFELLVEEAVQTARHDPSAREYAVNVLKTNCSPDGLWSSLIRESDAHECGIAISNEERRSNRRKLVAVTHKLVMDPNHSADCEKGIALAFGAQLVELIGRLSTIAESEQSPSHVRLAAKQAIAHLNSDAVRQSEAATAENLVVSAWTPWELLLRSVMYAVALSVLVYIAVYFWIVRKRDLGSGRCRRTL